MPACFAQGQLYIVTFVITFLTNTASVQYCTRGNGGILRLSPCTPILTPTRVDTYEGKKQQQVCNM